MTEARDRPRAHLFAIAAGAGALVTLLVIGAWQAWKGRSSTAASPGPTRVDVVLPDSVPMSFIGTASLGNGRRAFALSHDGRRLVYASMRGGVSRLYLRTLDSYEVVPLAGTEGAFGPFFSPDGQWIGFFVGNEMRKIRAEGGTPVRIAEASDSQGADWGTSGRIVFAAGEGDRLLMVSETAGR